MSQVVTSEPEISVVVPVRNEAGNVAPLVAEIAAALARVRERAAALGADVEGEQAGWRWSFTMHGPTGFESVEAVDLAAKTRDADGVSCITDYCRSHGIKIEAWGPLGQGKSDILEAPEVTDAAAAHDVSPAQVIIRWHLQNGVILFPKSATPSRIAENFDVFSFELTEEEMAAITALDEGEEGRGGPHPNDMNDA